MSRITDQSQFRVCVPAEDVIAGRLGDGVKDILALRNGEHGQHYISCYSNLTDVNFSASSSRSHQI